MAVVGATLLGSQSGSPPDEQVRQVAAATPADLRPLVASRLQALAAARPDLAGEIGRLLDALGA